MSPRRPASEGLRRVRASPLPALRRDRRRSDGVRDGLRVARRAASQGHLEQMRQQSVPAPEGFYGCPRCQTVKPVTEFSKHKGGPDGHSCYCRACKMDKKRELQARFESGAKEDLTIAERFFAKVYKGAEGGCWLWISTSQRYGYGTISWLRDQRQEDRVQSRASAQWRQSRSIPATRQGRQMESVPDVPYLLSRLCEPQAPVLPPRGRARCFPNLSLAEGTL